MYVAASKSIARTPVDSTSLASIGYSSDEHILEAEFRRGAIYRFFMVPGLVFDDLMRAESKGTYFNLFIKNRYPFIRRDR
jgi:hypothetical protein